jgi:hypothetical protein
LSRKSADSWCKSACLVLRSADFALLWFFSISWLFRFFKLVKNEHSPRDTTDLATDLVYILTSCTSCSLQKEEPCFRASSTSVSQVHLHSTWEDKGVETRLVDEGHLLFSARGGGVTFGYITSSTTIDEAVFYRVVRRGHVQNLNLLVI